MTEFFVIDIASVKNITIDLIGQSNKKGTLLLWIHLIFNWQVPFIIYIYIYIYIDQWIIYSMTGFFDIDIAIVKSIMFSLDPCTQ